MVKFYYYNIFVSERKKKNHTHTHIKFDDLLKKIKRDFSQWLWNEISRWWWCCSEAKVCVFYPGINIVGTGKRMWKNKRERERAYTHTVESWMCMRASARQRQLDRFNLPSLWHFAVSMAENLFSKNVLEN